MGRFEKYASPGTCAVCGKKTDVIVCCSAFGAMSFAYCKDCWDNQLEPYSAMVSYISCAGYFPDDINEEYQALCRHILNGLGVSEEKFIEDVKKENEEIDTMYAEYEKMMHGDTIGHDDFDFLAHEYMKFDCPECGAPLEVYADYLVEEIPAEFESFGYERRDLIRHCSKCHCDWVNEWWTENGDVGESQLRRKFWG